MSLSTIDTEIVLAVVRSTALLSGALLLAVLARRSSGAVKHTLWTVTIGSLLVLPFVAGAMPKAGLPWLTVSESQVQNTMLIPRDEPAVLSMTDLGLESGVPVMIEDRGDGMMALNLPSEPEQSMSLPGVLIVWLLGFLFAAGSLVVGMVRASRLARRAFPVADPLWRDRLEHAKALAGVTRSVALRCSTDIKVPMTGGIRRPVILLPASAGEWSTECLDVVLMHELVHVRRADVFRQVITRLAVALYWFHPLAWRAARQAILAREQACDEAVVATGTKPSRYARHLLALADDASAPLREPCLVGLDHAHLEERVMSILNDSPRSRGGLSSVMLVTTVAVLTLGVATLGPRDAGAQEPAPPPAPPTVVRVAPTPPVTPVVVPRVVSAITARVAPTPPVAPTVVSAITARVAPTAPVAPVVVSAIRARVAPTPPVVPVVVSAIRARVAPTPPVAPSIVSSVTPRIVAEVGRAVCDDVLPRTSGPSRRVHNRVDGLSVCAHVSGNLDELPEGVFIPSGRLPAGMTVTLGVVGSNLTQKMVITRGTSGNDHAWFVGGERRPFDSEAAAWRDAMIAVLEVDHEAARLHGEMAEIHGEAASIRGEEASLHGEMAAIQAEVARHQAETAHAMRAELAEVESVANEMRGRHAAEIRDQVRMVEREGRRVQQEMSRLEREMDNERDAEHRAELRDRMEVMRDHMVEVQSQHAEVAEASREQEEEMREMSAQLRQRASEMESHSRQDQTRVIAEAQARVAELQERMRERRPEGQIAELEERMEAINANGRMAELEARMSPARDRLREIVRRIGN